MLLVQEQHFKSKGAVPLPGSALLFKRTHWSERLNYSQWFLSSMNQGGSSQPLQHIRTTQGTWEKSSHGLTFQRSKLAGLGWASVILKSSQVFHSFQVSFPLVKCLHFNRYTCLKCDPTCENLNTNFNCGKMFVDRQVFCSSNNNRIRSF